MNTEENNIIESTIDEFYQKPNQDHLINLLTAIRLQADREGRLLVPVQVDADEGELFNPDKVGVGDTVTVDGGLHFTVQVVQDEEGRTWWTAFTSEVERNKGQATSVFNSCIHDYFDGYLQGHEDIAGIVINPWDKPVRLSRQLIEAIEQNNTEPEK